MIGPSQPHTRAATRVWRFRARAEVQLAGRFTQIARDLLSVGEPTQIIDLVTGAAQDELRHAHLCTQLANDLSGQHVEIPAPVHFDSPALPKLSREQIVTLQLVGLSCINETISATALTRMLPASRHGPAHPVVHEILRDEVRHARLGWAHLAQATRTQDLGFVTRWLPRLLDEAVQDELFTQPNEVSIPRELRALEGLGALGSAQRREVFIEALEGLVMPGLEQVGIDTASIGAWLKTRLSKLGASDEPGGPSKPTQARD